MSEITDSRPLTQSIIQTQVSKVNRRRIRKSPSVNYYVIDDNLEVEQYPNDTYMYFSLGMGQQSTLFVIWAANNVDWFEKYVKSQGASTVEFIFSDTGEEEKETYRYINNILIPYIEKLDFQITVIKQPVDLVEYFDNKNQVPLGWVNNICSSHFKRDTINYYLRERLSSNHRIYSKDTTVIEVIGIGPDEIDRAKPPQATWKVRHYPLCKLKVPHKDKGIPEHLETGYKELARYSCVEEYEKYDISSPPPSGCWICPNKGEKHFKELAVKNNRLFQRAVKLEMTAEGNPPPTLLSKGSLTDLIERQTSLSDYFDDDNWSNDQCDGGYCFT